VTTNQILIGVGLILALAAGSQVLASRLRIPAIIVLLPAGFVAGALTSDVNPQDLLGPAFEPLVSLSVAVILYDAGLSLDMRKLKGHTRKVVIRLIVLGVLITWVLAASLAAPLLGMSRGAAVMLGIILVVSGPTVVGPLLSFVRPTERLQQVLIWEGSLIDPVGGILGALVFHAVIASTRKGPGSQLLQFAASIGVGLAGGVAGTALLWLLLRRLRLGEVLGTTAQLAAVIAVAAACDVIRDDAGLIAAIFMGLALANRRGFDIPARRPFFETLVQLIIGVLFISISATVTPQSLRHLLLPTLAMVAVLVLVARPHRRVRVHAENGPDERRACVRRLDGSTWHRRRGHRVDVRGWPGRQGHRRRRQDPACHIRGDRSDGDPLRPDRGAGRPAIGRHPARPHSAAPSRRRSVGYRTRTGPAVRGPGGRDVGWPGSAAGADQARGAGTGAR
jgi:NhaP-type Na+/H+ or K+/H+ antiporter